jgi:hypothetical protein
LAVDFFMLGAQSVVDDWRQAAGMGRVNMLMEE